MAMLLFAIRLSSHLREIVFVNYFGHTFAGCPAELERKQREINISEK